MHRCWGVPRPLQIHRLTVLLWGSQHTCCAFPEAAKGEPAESAQQPRFQGVNLRVCGVRADAEAPSL